MEIWYNLKNIEKKTFGKKEKYDNNIFTFDIETTSFIEVNGLIQEAIKYDDYDEDIRDKLQKDKKLKYYANMYIWQFGVNDTVYYGRTWDEFKSFLRVLDNMIPEKKIVFVHNLAFEFQFLKGEFNFKDVMARKSRKVMTATLLDYNIIFKCSYFMSNAALSELPKLYKLPVEKKVGELDYNVLRNSKTILTKEELEYCEYDCLVVYHYILYELKEYETVKNIPTTSTGHVRRELKDLTRSDFKYKRIVKKAINTDGVIFNKMQDAFAGGVTHANYLYSDKVLTNIDSYDETSAYPYVLTCFRFPSSEFKHVELRDKNDMCDGFCYILDVEFKNVNSRYYNTYISSSKCRDLRGCVYDNGRVISADSFEMTITDVDFYLILDCYECEYKIKDAWFSNKAYLPKRFIEFVLDKYVKKTQYKNLEEFELEYMKEKNKFNALYGMSVTNNIRSNVIYDNDTKLWHEEELTNEEILDALKKEKARAFLSFSYGIFCTAIARDNLFRRVMALDDYVAYMDTDSIKLIPGYDKKIIDSYNKEVERRINYTSRVLRIDKERFAPKDKDGIPHMLGLFEFETNGIGEHTYKKFCTQGAKKYCYVRDEKDKTSKDIIKDKLSITVAGIPKKLGCKCLNSIEEFKDGLYFSSKITNKQSAVYIDDLQIKELTDYQGNVEKVVMKSAVCLIPTSYTLGKSHDYQQLLTDNSSKRARFNYE